MNKDICPECGHERLEHLEDTGCLVELGSDHNFDLCPCMLTPSEVHYVIERDEARTIARKFYKLANGYKWACDEADEDMESMAQEMERDKEEIIRLSGYVQALRDAKEEIKRLRLMISQHAPIPPGEWCHVCGSDWVDGGCPECGK